jgi:23S rRNA (uridine2552-2'-O)-methyltransferase
MSRKRKLDHYQKRAKKEGYKSRASYKLKAIQQKYSILKKGDVVLDLCGAPGGFSQVAREIIGNTGCVLLVDIAKVKYLDNVECICGDITDDSVKLQIFAKIKELSVKGKVDAILADCSPNVSGNWSTDHNRQIWLAENVLDIAVNLQCNKLVCKVFMGAYFQEFTNTVKKHYRSVRYYKPPPSRKESAEIYLVSKGFRSNNA